jgi:hypothetical protein
LMSKSRSGLDSFGNAKWNGKTYICYIILVLTARVKSTVYGKQIIISNDVYELPREKLLKFLEC